MATVNGLGDCASSVIVGLLWQAAHPAAGFLYSGILSLAGSWLIFRSVRAAR